MQQVYLTRRNLQTLLNKLDRGSGSAHTIIKKDTKHSKYPCSDIISVTAVEDKDYYTNREPGYVHPLDLP